MNSELKEFLEWTKTVRRQFEIDMDETWLTKPPIERVAIENLLIAYDQMAERLRTPSPSGGIKTAEEVLAKVITEDDTDDAQSVCIEAMHAYHNQFAGEEIYGYVFNGKFFRSLDDMRGMTMSEDNKPTPVYIHNQFARDGWKDIDKDGLPKIQGDESEYLCRGIKSTHRNLTDAEKRSEYVVCWFDDDKFHVSWDGKVYEDNNDLMFLTHYKLISPPQNTKES